MFSSITPVLGRTVGIDQCNPYTFGYSPIRILNLPIKVRSIATSRIKIERDFMVNEFAEDRRFGQCSIFVHMDSGQGLIVTPDIGKEPPKDVQRLFLA
jgi:CTP-dependent riboflavin kinase